jgi:hypothetical protein
MSCELMKATGGKGASRSAETTRYLSSATSFPLWVACDPRGEGRRRCKWPLAPRLALIDDEPGPSVVGEPPWGRTGGRTSPAQASRRWLRGGGLQG